MKTIVSMQELRELEIKPSDLLAEYQKRLEKEVRTLWKEKLSPALQRCPACANPKLEYGFEKWAVVYMRCGRCDSLFTATRPSEEVLNGFYAKSQATAYWKKEVLNATESVRLEKLIVPRCEWILDGLSEYLPDAATGLDFTPFGAAMLELLAKNHLPLESCIAAHPLSGAVAGQKKIIPSAGALYAKPSPKVDFITAFDAFDRASDPKAFVDALRGCLNKGGVAFLTATSGSGFEIQLLGGRSPAVLPPDRLNLASIEGLRTLFRAPEWEICEISTPGLLDVEIVKRNLPDSDCERKWPFMHYVMRARGQATHDALQEFLQTHLLSSFTRLIVRKK